MQDLVSTRWIRITGLAAPLAVALATLALSGSAWMAWMSLVWVGLAVSGPLWVVPPAPAMAMARVPSVPPIRTAVH